MRWPSAALDRRTLLIGGGAGVGLIVAFAAWPRRGGSPLRAAAGEEVFGPYLRIATDGRVTVAVPQAETGQGAWTGLAQIAADELGAAWDSVGGRARAARAGLCQPPRRRHAADRAIDFDPRVRSAAARGGGDGARDAGRSGGGAVGRRCR